MYSMFVVLQTTSNVIDSRIVAAVDRTCTDVAFNDSFILYASPKNNPYFLLTDHCFSFSSSKLVLSTTNNMTHSQMLASLLLMQI